MEKNKYTVFTVYIYLNHWKSFSRFNKEKRKKLLIGGGRTGSRISVWNSLAPQVSKVSAKMEHHKHALIVLPQSIIDLHGPNLSNMMWTSSGYD